MRDRLNNNERHNERPKNFTASMLFCCIYNGEQRIFMGNLLQIPALSKPGFFFSSGLQGGRDILPSPLPFLFLQT